LPVAFQKSLTYSSPDLVVTRGREEAGGSDVETALHFERGRLIFFKIIEIVATSDQIRYFEAMMQQI